MKIAKTISNGKIISLSITFDTDDEIGCIEDMVTLTERSLCNYFEFRSELPDVLSTIKKELS